MPHIIVEHTGSLDLDVPKLLNDLHHNLASQDTAVLGAIKTRAIALAHNVIGEETDNDQMIHVTLKLLPGRDDDLKTVMAQGLFDITRKHATKGVSVTTEVTELHAASYMK